MSQIRYPKTVSILSKDDICRGAFVGPRGKRCLLGQTLVDFRCPQARDRVKQKIYKEIMIINKYCKQDNLYTDTHIAHCIAAFNDSGLVSLSVLARIWNRVMARLGYVTNNPEANKLREPIVHKRKG